MIKGRINQIESMGLVDGPGIRTVFFMQGCPLRCLYCHNPEMQDAKTKVKLYTPQEVVEIAKRYKPYYGKDGGVTFSGGEPLLQSEFLLEAAKLLKAENINVALDTSGVGGGNLELLNYVDLVIFDVKAVDEDEYNYITKQKISASLKFLETCQKMKKKMWLRQVIVPGINDDAEHIERLKKFIKPLKKIQKVELLPYHTMAKPKYAKLNRDYPLKDTPAMDKSRCKSLENLLLS